MGPNAVNYPSLGTLSSLKTLGKTMMKHSGSLVFEKRTTGYRRGLAERMKKKMRERQDNRIQV